ncbi:MAG TPA: energy transducer TonB [Myxococcales bacterium]|nr:energy transducer TonB [Myxococcales bacterium]
MRRLLALTLPLLACAHGPRPLQPERWHELNTEHFVLRTDLALGDARRTVVDLEEVRAALLAAGWKSSRPPPAKTQVIVLADDAELEQYAMKGIGGFVSSDAFGEPIMVVSGSQDPDEQRFLKHELAHVITNQFLIRNPRWVAEGLACYLETLRFDRKRGKLIVGEASAERVQFLDESPVPSYWAILSTGREAEQMSAREGFAFESGAWLVVHWLVDVRTQAFDDMLSRLALGEDPHYAFSKSFPDLNDDTMKVQIAAYWKARKVGILRAPTPRWAGPVSERSLPAGEVYAILADLQRLSPGYPHTAARELRKNELLAQAIQADPGNPLAIQLSDDADASKATAAHPDDWRAWLAFADKNGHDLTALRTARKLAPGNPGVLSRLAWAEQQRGDRELALQYAKRAAEIAPGRSDVLVVLGTVLADAGRCGEGEDSVQRAIDVLPDDADRAAVASLRKTQRAVEEHCRKLASLKTSERRVLTTLKGCDPRGMRFGRRDRAKGKLTAEFRVGPDGKVADIQIKGDANESAAAVVKNYVQSCKYEPVIQDGKPVEVRWQVDFAMAR